MEVRPPQGVYHEKRWTVSPSLSKRDYPLEIVSKEGDAMEQIILYLTIVLLIIYFFGKK